MGELVIWHKRHQSGQNQPTSETVSSRKQISLANSSKVNRKLPSALSRCIRPHVPRRDIQVDKKHRLIGAIYYLIQGRYIFIPALIPSILIYLLLPPRADVQLLDGNAGRFVELCKRVEQVLLDTDQIDGIRVCLGEGLYSLESDVAFGLPSVQTRKRG